MWRLPAKIPFQASASDEAVREVNVITTADKLLLLSTIFTRSLIILNDSWHLFLHYLLEENVISYWCVSETDTNKLADSSLLTDKTGLCEVTLRAISKHSLINATWRASSTLEVFNFRR